MVATPARQAPGSDGEARPVRRRPAPAARDHAAAAPAATGAVSGEGTLRPALRHVVAAAVAAGRSPWLAVAVLLAAIAYVLGQRALDGGRKLAHAGRNEPDDELIEL